MQDLNDKTTGGTLSAAEWNEVPSEIQNVIEGLGLTLSSGDLNQLGKSIAGYVANGNFYTDSGIADAYVLSKVGLKQTATAYTDGFFGSFLAGNDNTGASTVNVAALGVKNILLPGGVALAVGDISGRVDLAFDNANDRFVLLNPKITGKTFEFDTTIAMESSPLFKEGMKARTLGYYIKGDGGGAEYDSISGIGTANALNIIASIVAAISFVLRLESVMTVPQFGAKGDKDTGNTDDTLPIQAAIDNSPGGKLIFPDRQYRTTATIYVIISELDIEFLGTASLRPDTDVLIGAIVGDPVIKPGRSVVTKLKVDRTTLSTATENIGVQFMEQAQNDFTSVESRFSKYNFKWIATAGGLAHNNYNNMQAIGGVRNYWLTATAPGFVNENKFFGGRGFNSGSVITNLYLEGGVAVNHNLFYGMNLEGAGTQSIFCDGLSNVFHYPRTEGSWTLGDVVFGPNAQFNHVEAARIDTGILDNSTTQTNTWNSRLAGHKKEGGDNGITFDKKVFSGAHTAPGAANAITAITAADPVVATSAAHTLATGDFITIRKVVGMVELNGRGFLVGTTTVNTFEIKDTTTGVVIDGTAFNAYTSGGYAMAGIPMNSIEDTFFTSGISHIFDWYHGRDGATSFVWRSIRDSDGLVRSSLTTNGKMDVALAYSVAGNKVLGNTITSWSATSGTELRTNFGDASLSDTSQALRALIVDLKTHGMIS